MHMMKATTLSLSRNSLKEKGLEVAKQLIALQE